MSGASVFATVGYDENPSLPPIMTVFILLKEVRDVEKKPCLAQSAVIPVSRLGRRRPSRALSARREFFHSGPDALWDRGPDGRRRGKSLHYRPRRQPLPSLAHLSRAPGARSGGLRSGAVQPFGHRFRCKGGPFPLRRRQGLDFDAQRKHPADRDDIRERRTRDERVLALGVKVQTLSASERK